MELSELKPLYSEAVKSKIADRKLIEQQQAELDKAAAENQRLKEQYQPEEFVFNPKSGDDPPAIAHFTGQGKGL